MGFPPDIKRAIFPPDPKRWFLFGGDTIGKKWFPPPDPDIK